MERVSWFILLSTRARGSIVLRSDFVEPIEHFVARPQHHSTQREDQESGHFLIPPIKLCGSVSVDEFSVELIDAVASVLVFAEFYLCYDAESFLLQGIQL